MDLLTTEVVICDDNRTRADLYALWLDGCEVAVAPTPKAAYDHLNRGTAAVVHEESFPDPPEESMSTVIQAQAPLARVVRTTARQSPTIPVEADHALEKPLTETELQDIVERCVYRSNYHHALGLYYETTASLAALDVQDDGEDDERRERLRDRARRLERLVRRLSAALSEEDIASVREKLAVGEAYETRASPERIESKYQPESCSECGQDWDEPSASVTQLGANIWRCGACGHVQMKTDPSHRGIGSYR